MPGILKQQNVHGLSLETLPIRNVIERCKDGHGGKEQVMEDYTCVYNILVSRGSPNIIGEVAQLLYEALNDFDDEKLWRLRIVFGYFQRRVSSMYVSKEILEKLHVFFNKCENLTERKRDFDNL